MNSMYLFLVSILLICFLRVGYVVYICFRGKDHIISVLINTLLGVGVVAVFAVSLASLANSQQALGPEEYFLDIFFLLTIVVTGPWFFTMAGMSLSQVENTKH